MSMTKRVFTGFATALVLSATAHAQDAQNGSAATAENAAPETRTDVTADTVVATVNGTEITMGDMIVLRGQLPQQYRSLPDEVLFDAVLEQLIQQTALMQNLGDDLSKRDRLILESNRRSYLAGAALGRTAENAVTEQALRELYDSQYAEFTPETEYNAAHILVETEEEAQEIKTAIDGGADFAEQARAHSADGSASSGGDLGWFGLGMMVPQFEEAVVTLEVGAISDPVQTQFGWHLIRLIDTRETTAPTFEEARPELAETLQRQAAEALITEVSEAAEITRSAEGIDPGTLSDQSLLEN
jgi:peptidyl-prolyl cis-trans isomerase C